MTTGKPDRRDPVQAAQQLEVVLERLAEADPGVDHDALLAHALADRELDALLEEGADVVDDVVVARVVLHRARLAEHVHQAAVAAAIGHEAGELGLVAERGDVVDEGGAGVDAPPRPRSSFAVSTLICDAGAAQRARRRGRRGAAPRRSSPARHRGRVDSPPMSRMSAPSAISARACSTARSKANHSPAVGERVGRDVEDAHDARVHRPLIVGPRGLNRPPGAPMTASMASSGTWLCPTELRSHAPARHGGAHRASARAHVRRARRRTGLRDPVGRLVADDPGRRLQLDRLRRAAAADHQERAARVHGRRHRPQLPGAPRAPASR